MLFLIVHVRKLRSPKSVDKTMLWWGDVTDLYVEIIVNSKVVGRTRTVWDNENPQWNEHVCIPFPTRPAATPYVSARLVDANKILDDKILHTTIPEAMENFLALTPLKSDVDDVECEWAVTHEYHNNTVSVLEYKMQAQQERAGQYQHKIVSLEQQYNELQQKFDQLTGLYRNRTEALQKRATELKNKTVVLFDDVVAQINRLLIVDETNK